MDDWQREAEAREANEARERFDRRLRGELQPIANIPLAEFKAAIDRVQASALKPYASTVCQGLSEKIFDCQPRDERACPERLSSGCPKRIAEWERRRADCIGFDLVKLWKGHGMPGDAAKKIARGDVSETGALKLAEGWWAKKPRPRALVLLGTNDAGKTFAGCVLMSRFSGWFVTAQEVANRSRDEGWIHRMLLPGLLILDELGLEAGFADGAVAVARLLSQRIDGGVFTIVTGNIKPEDIRPRYGTALADRIAKLGQVEGAEAVGMRRLDELMDEEPPQGWQEKYDR